MKLTLGIVVGDGNHLILLNHYHLYILALHAITSRTANLTLKMTLTVVLQTVGSLAITTSVASGWIVLSFFQHFVSVEDVGVLHNHLTELLLSNGAVSMILASYAVTSRASLSPSQTLTVQL